jgi:hypothetical protein
MTAQLAARARAIAAKAANGSELEESGSLSSIWALDEAPGVPPSLVSTLAAIARYADQDGRGAHPSATTVARHTRKSESQAKRDIAALEKLGLLQRGDQSAVAYIRADQRPTVYDLPMPRGSTDDTPSSRHGVAPMTPREVDHGVAPVRARGSTGAQNGVAPVLPEEIQKRSRTRARGAAGADAAPHAQPKPPWCGECDERTRQTGDPPRRCPECHPLAGQEPHGRHARTGDGAALATITAGVAQRTGQALP